MTETDLVVPATDVVSAVERCAAEAGLQIMRGKLAKYPGSTHWHFTMPGSNGTLECTWWPQKNRLWLAAHSNRVAKWHEAATAYFTAQFH